MAYRLSAHNWMRPEPLEVTLARLQRCGFWGIEIMGEPERYPTKQTRKLLDKYSLKCWGSVSIMLKCRDLINADYYLRLGSQQYLKDCITMVSELGGEIMTIVPSEVGKINAMSSPEQEWAWAVEGLKKVADHAAKKNVRIAIEPLNRFETNFLNRHDQALALAKDVGGDHVGICLDAFHINIEEKDPYQAILNAGKKLFDFHIADNNRAAPGDGNWDWKKLLATLKKAGYEGCLTTEFVISNDRTPCGPHFGKKASQDTAGSAAEEKFIIDHGGYVMTDAEYSKHFERTEAHIRKCEPK